MAVAIKRVIQFSHAKMNSVQSEQTRLRAKNKYKNDHIKEEFKKYNLHPVDNTEGLTYNQYFKKYCKRRSGGKKKSDVVSEMGKEDFYLDKLYTGKGGGRTTCCVESMVISLNDRIDATAEAVLAYQADPKNQKKMQDFVKYIMETDERFKYCRFLNVDWHFDEVYTPFERKEPTEEYPEGEIVVGNPKISIHGHITYIPLTKEVDASGKEYLSLNRGAVWKSRTAAYNQSYSQFNDDIYEAVEKELGYERGKLYPASEKDRNEDLNIQDWIIVHNGEMERQYKEQERLKLMTEEERTQILTKEYGEAHRKKMEAAQAEIKQAEEKNQSLKTQNNELSIAVRYRKLCTESLEKQIEEKKKHLKDITQQDEEKSAELEQTMKEYNEIRASVTKLMEEQKRKEVILKQSNKDLDDNLAKVNEKKKNLEIRNQKIKEEIAHSDQTVQIFSFIEAQIRQHKLDVEKAAKLCLKNSLDDVVSMFRTKEAREITPALYQVAERVQDAYPTRGYNSSHDNKNFDDDSR